MVRTFIIGWDEDDRVSYIQMINEDGAKDDLLGGRSERDHTNMLFKVRMGDGKVRLFKEMQRDSGAYDDNNRCQKDSKKLAHVLFCAIIAGRSEIEEEIEESEYL